MEEEKRISRAAREELRRRGVEQRQVLAAACADMTREGELRNLYLTLTDSQLIFMVSSLSGEQTYSGIPGDVTGTGEGTASRGKEEIAETYSFDRERLSEPEVIGQVVGGLFKVRLDGEEQWLCRFSSSRMREMSRLCQLMKGEEPSREEEEACCPKCGAPYPERGRAVCPRCMEKRAIFWRILTYFKEYRGRVALMLIFLTLSGLFNVLWPLLTGSFLYDRVLGQDEDLAQRLGIPGNFALMLLLLTLASVGAQLLMHLTSVLHGRQSAYVVPSVVCKLKQKVFDSLSRLSIGFFTRRQTGSLMQRVNNDANEVTGFFIDGLPFLLYNVATFSFAAVVMFATDWRLAIVCFILLPPLFFVSYRMLPRFWHAHGRRARTNRKMYSLLHDSFEGARVVKAFGQEEQEARRFVRVNSAARDAEMNVVRYGSLYDIAYSVARQVPVVLVWLVGALLVLDRSAAFTYGMLLTFINYLNMMQGPLEFFSNIFRFWTSSMNAGQRVFEIIDAVPEITESPQAVKPDIRGEVELRGVTFGYEANKPVLKNVSFRVEAGEMLGIVGKSGAGKSTLVNLITRLYDPDAGEVLLDGVNVRDIAFSTLRGSVAMVSQETYIFMGTIAENIAYAKPDASREEIVRAAQAASAHAFICRLPDGYDTLIGTGGRQLSGGERQRLSIARAILADPRILVLDEATASVDTETERAIQDSLDRLIQGRTTISIAHRLSTLRSADHLIVLEEGCLIENGTHPELVEKRGVYYKLLQLQSKALAMRGIGGD
ncbi:MAG: ATP-binding cassette domain-containing protein [Clostridiales bacterium]|nr:ATP-binding cassette domain-containing protein [Clostridiales bacterium]